MALGPDEIAAAIAADAIAEIDAALKRDYAFDYDAIAAKDRLRMRVDLGRTFTDDVKTDIGAAYAAWDTVEWDGPVIILTYTEPTPP